MKKEVTSGPPKVSIILPTRNEEKSIVKIIKEIKELKKKFSLEIIVTDGAEGIIAVLESGTAEKETFNIASPTEFTIEEIVRIIWRLMEKKDKLTFKYKPTGNKDIRRNPADINKAKNLVSWYPKIEMNAGLSDLI